VTKGGKIMSFSVMVVVGNGKGGAGFGLGKALSMLEATRKATVKATKAMTFIPRYHNSTIYHPIDHEFHKTRIRLFPADMGISSSSFCFLASKIQTLLLFFLLTWVDYGIRVHHAIQSICHCAGIQAIGGKVYGSRNVINVVRGTFEGKHPSSSLPFLTFKPQISHAYSNGPFFFFVLALESQETHLERARRLGLKAVDLHQTTFDRELEENERFNQMQLELLKVKLAKKPTFSGSQEDDDEAGQNKKKKLPGTGAKKR